MLWWFVLLFNVCLYHLFGEFSQGFAKIATRPRCFPQYRFWRWENSFWINRELRHFRYWTILLGERSGGHETWRCIWSVLQCPFSMVRIRASKHCLISSKYRGQLHRSEFVTIPGHPYVKVLNIVYRMGTSLIFLAHSGFLPWVSIQP